jgi:alkylation response protein AidB-like acyl-CoA dehydrogenase
MSKAAEGERGTVNLAYDDSQELMRGTVRQFLLDREVGRMIRETIESADTFNRELWREGATLGWAGMLIPEEFGGSSVTEQPMVDLVALAEELGRVLYPGPFIPTNVVADAIVRSGTTEVRQSLLPLIASGELVAAWCATGDGTPNVASVEVAAQLVDGGLVLNGTSRYVHGAHNAAVFLVVALNGDEQLAVIVSPIIGLDLTRRFSVVHFDNVVVRNDHVLDDGSAVAERAFQLATVLKSAENVGAAEYLLGVTVNYAKERVQFGRPIGSFQALKHRLADLLISLEAMRAAVRYAALALAESLVDADEALAVAGSYVSDAFSRMCGESLQIHGGIGFTWEHEVHLFVRRAKVDQVLYGDAAWHRGRLCDLAVQTIGDARRWT